MKYLVLKNWERFQHYKDRDPPWVKLYRDLLTSESWVLGTDSSRLVQLASVLLAARYSNKIPYRYDLIKKVASLEMGEGAFTKAVQHLASTDFLEIQEVTDAERIVVQDASTPLATCSSEAEQSRGRAEAEKKGGASAPLVAVAGLDIEAWNRWETYRLKTRRTIKPESIPAAQRELAGFGAEQAAVVEHSIANGYQGLFAPKRGANGHGRKPYKPAPTTAELEAREAANAQRGS